MLSVLTTLAQVPDKGLAIAGIAIGMGVAVLGAGKGIGHIGGQWRL